MREKRLLLNEDNAGSSLISRARSFHYFKRLDRSTLWCLIEGGVGIVGGFEKSPKPN